MKNKLYIIITIIAIGLISCDTKTKKKAVPAKIELNSPYKLSELWETLSSKKTPFIDSTNFDNIGGKKKLNEPQLKALQIDAIYPNFYKYQNQYKVFLAYKLDLSHLFYTIVINVYKGEHELETVLANYNRKNESLISFKTIAYDEIAEGWSRKLSKVNNNIITITDELYLDELESTITKYHINQVGEINPIKTEFSSRLKVDKLVTLGETYVDTLVFQSYNNDGDYFLLLGKKNGVDVGLIYNWEWQDEDSKYNLKYGDLINVIWKMDSIWIAGDGETLDFMETAIDIEKIMQDKSKPIKFLWREDVFDYQLEQKVNSIIINQSFCNTITIQEKAALGYISFDIGNECWWDGKANEDRSNLKCKILTHLDLGYQCSEKQLDFLRKWFSKDQKALKKLKNCGTMPYTSTIQNTFDEINIFTNEETRTITVNYKAHGINTREATKWCWTEKVTFTYTEESIFLTNAEKSEMTRERIEITGN